MRWNEILIEALGGLGVGIVLALPIGIILTSVGVDVFSASLLAVLIYPVGAALGVVWVGKRYEHRGKFWYALVGATIPIMVLALLGVGVTASVLEIGIAVLSPIFAAIAYHRFARPTDPMNPYDEGEVDLLEYHEEGWDEWN